MLPEHLVSSHISPVITPLKPQKTVKICLRERQTRDFEPDILLMLTLPGNTQKRIF